MFVSNIRVGPVASKSVMVVSCMLIAFGVVSCGDDDEKATETDGTLIGTSDVDLDTRLEVTHVGEAPVGNLITDAVKSRLQAENHAVDIALVNAGFIRGGAYNEDDTSAMFGKVYPKGNVYEEWMAEWFPFDNAVIVGSVTGTQLKSALERAASALPPDLSTWQNGGWFLQVAGLNYQISCSGTPQAVQINSSDPALSMVTTEGSRVVYLKVGSEVIYDVRGTDPASHVDLMATKTYRYVSTDFVAEGQDGHISLRGTKLRDESAQLPAFADFNLKTIVRDYIKANSPIAPANDGRIVVDGTCGRPLGQ